LTFIEGAAPSTFADVVPVDEIRAIRLADPQASWAAVCARGSVVLLQAADWLVTFEAYGTPRDVASIVAAQSDRRVVCMYWNVEFDNEFTVWEQGRKVVSFDGIDPDTRFGEDPDRFLVEMQDAGFWSEDPNFRRSYFVMAQLITGCRVERDFLLGDVIIARRADGPSES
jgi:hypothetical protein